MKSLSIAAFFCFLLLYSSTWAQHAQPPVISIAVTDSGAISASYNSTPLLSQNPLPDNVRDFIIKNTSTNRRVQLKNKLGSTLIIEPESQVLFKQFKQEGGNFIVSDSVTSVAYSGNNSVGHSQILFTISKGNDSSPTEVNMEKGYKPGATIYDAFVVRQDPGGDRSLKILAYYSGLPQPVDIDTIIKIYGESPFKIIVTKKPGEKNATRGLTSLLSSAGGIDVTNIADGLSRFIVKRTKEELNLAFFTKFKEALDSVRDLRSLFPETYRSLRLIGEDVYNYSRYIQTLRENFQNDLNNLPENLPTIINNHPEFFQKYLELAVTLQSSCYFAGALKDKTHPGDVLQNFPTEYLNGLKAKNLKGAIQVAQWMSEGLRDTAEGETAPYWVDAKKIKELIKDKDAFKIFWALMYQRAKVKYNGIEFDTTSLAAQMDLIDSSNVENYVDGTLSFFTEVSNKTSKLNVLIKSNSKPENDSLAVEHYANYFRTALDLMRTGTDAYKLIPELPATTKIRTNLLTLRDRTADYFEASQSASDIVLALNRKRYSAAIANASNILYLILGRTNEEDQNGQKSEEGILLAQKDSLKQVKKKLNDPDKLKKIKLKINEIDLTLKSYRTLRKDIATVFRYGTFMASVAQAQNSEEVSDAIEAFALPSGSSRIKRESSFNVSLNAYAGIFAGYEKIQGLQTDGPFKFQLDKQMNSTGVAAPIGIAISLGRAKFLDAWNWGNGKYGHWSYSAFLSLIDLGAIAAFRFQDDSTTQVPSIQLKDIVAPGLFLSIGIPKSPLSINAGAQVGPNLRKVGIESNNYEDALYWRYSLSLCVDIPVLNFYTKTAR